MTNLQYELRIPQKIYNRVTMVEKVYYENYVLEMTLLFDMYNICRKKMLCDKLCNKQFFRSVQVCFRLEYFLSAGFWKFWLQKRPFSPNYDILTMSCVYPVDRICKIDNLRKCMNLFLLYIISISEMFCCT